MEIFLPWSDCLTSETPLLRIGVTTLIKVITFPKRCLRSIEVRETRRVYLVGYRRLTKAIFIVLQRRVEARIGIEPTNRHFTVKAKILTPKNRAIPEE